MDTMINISLNDFDAVIFDMDGTMINNMAYHKKAWKEFARRHGFDFTEEEFKEKFSGKKNDQIFAGIFGSDLPPDEAIRYGEEKEAIYRELYAADIEPVAGLHHLIETMQKAGKKVAVATTAPKDNRDFGFKALQLEDVFAVVLGEEHVTNGKPHPEIYLETAKRLEVAPERCLVFEDSPAGVASGKAAGMIVVGILTTHSEEELKDADYLVHDFTSVTFRE